MSYYANERWGVGGSAGSEREGTAGGAVSQKLGVPGSRGGEMGPRMTIDHAKQGARHLDPGRGAAPGEGSSTRRRILQIALALMAQRGVDGTSMRDLASAAGLNVASLYHYFPSKRDLLEAVLVEQGFLPIQVPRPDGDPDGDGRGEGGVTGGSRPPRPWSSSWPTSSSPCSRSRTSSGSWSANRCGTSRPPGPSGSTSSPRSRPSSRIGSGGTAPTWTSGRAPPRWHDS